MAAGAGVGSGVGATFGASGWRGIARAAPMAPRITTRARTTDRSSLVTGDGAAAWGAGADQAAGATKTNATSANSTHSTSRRIVNCHSRRSTPRRLRYTAESPPNVPDRPVPRDWSRIAAISAMLRRIWPMARIGFTSLVTSWSDGGGWYQTSRSGRPEKRPPRHPGPPLEPGELEDRRRDVGEDPVRQAPAGHRSADRQQRHGVERVPRHGVAAGVDHVVGVPMVRGHEQNRPR